MMSRIAPSGVELKCVSKGKKFKIQAKKLIVLMAQAPNWRRNWEEIMSEPISGLPWS